MKRRNAALVLLTVYLSILFCSFHHVHTHLDASVNVPAVNEFAGNAEESAINGESCLLCDFFGTSYTGNLHYETVSPYFFIACRVDGVESNAVTSCDASPCTIRGPCLS